MASHNQLGKKGEDLAVDFLKKNGYQILERNWRSGQEEIDIIASKGYETVVFIEVKTRSTSYFGYPEAAVRKEKQQHLLEAANAYLEVKNWDSEIRFDILAIIFSGDQCEDIYHIQDAIVPFS